jgi:hypothetical protein
MDYPTGKKIRALFAASPYPLPPIRKLAAERAQIKIEQVFATKSDDRAIRQWNCAP